MRDWKISSNFSSFSTHLLKMLIPLSSIFIQRVNLKIYSDSVWFIFMLPFQSFAKLMLNCRFLRLQLVKAVRIVHVQLKIDFFRRVLYLQRARKYSYLLCPSSLFFQC